MHRFDRALAILLLLRGGKLWSASELARHFEVSPRTIYRDVEALSAVGVPVYAEQGRNGGFRLLPGYFLPPVMLSSGEAVSLLLGLAVLRSLRARPYADEMATAERKLLVVLPDRLRATLAVVGAIIGFEQPPDDIFHPEPAPHETAPPASAREGPAITTFLQAILGRRMVRMVYRSPYRGQEEVVTLTPLGLFADRDRWYLVGQPDSPAPTARLWRADRVLTVAPTQHAVADANFDVRDLLGRAWLRPAMASWSEEFPVLLRLTAAQAELLRRDWYYRHARYEPQADGAVIVTFGDYDRAVVFALLRWLGPGAELLAPAAWRAEFRAELAQMLACYDDGFNAEAQRRSDAGRGRERRGRA